MDGKPPFTTSGGSLAGALAPALLTHDSFDDADPASAAAGADRPERGGAARPAVAGRCAAVRARRQHPLPGAQPGRVLPPPDPASREMSELQTERSMIAELRE